MQPKFQPSQSQKLLFEYSLEEICYPKNPLFVLANQIDWKRFDDAFKPFYCDGYGRPAKPTRLMVALQYLKYTFNLSDEETLCRWVENPYWQYFSGESVFQNEYPTDPSNMTRWRKRIGEDRIKILFDETIRMAQESKAIKPKETSQVIVDTTFMEKSGYGKEYNVSNRRPTSL